MSISQEAKNIVSSMGFSQEEWDLYRKAIAIIESQGSGGYSAVGGSGDDYDGKYQLGSRAKQDAARIAGVRNPGDSSAGRKSFRDNPAQQELFFAAYTKANFGYLSNNPKFVNANSQEKLEILGYAHNQGHNNTNNYLNTGRVGVDTFNTSGTKYIEEVAKAFRRDGRTPVRLEVQKFGETAKDPATQTTTTSDKPVPVPDKELEFNNPYYQLSNEQLDAEIESNRKQVDELNKKAKDLWTDEEKEKYKMLSAETDALINARSANDLLDGAPTECNARETAKGFTFKDTPACEKYFNSVAFRSAITTYQTERDLPDPCGTSEMSKINTELQKFFTIVKGIKKYGNLYVNGSINKVKNITSLIRNSSRIIAAVLKTLTNRLRDYLLKKIRAGIEDLIEMLLPTVARAIKNTVIQTVIDNIFCAFKDIAKGFVNLVTDFLFELVGKIVNVPFCAAQQFTNALVNNIAAVVDDAVGPVLDQINDVLGGITKIVGNVFQALDYILGFEAFLCAKPNCPEIKKFKASPWGGPSQAQIDDFAGFLDIPSEGDIIDDATKFIDDFEIFKEPLGDSAGTIPSSITKCDVSAFKCGPPRIEIFGGGGIGAVAEAVVDNAGRTIGVDLINRGSGYTRPPFVSFVDSCEDTFTSGYAIIDETGNGEVADIVLTSGPTPAPPLDGRTEFDPVSDGKPPLKDFVVCLEGFRVLDTGVGYTVNDSITITPDVPGLRAAVQMTEFGQIVSIQIATNACGLPGYPEIEINSETGEGAVIEPILSFTPVADFDESSDVSLDGPIDTLRGRTVMIESGFARKRVVRVIDCIDSQLVGYVNGAPYYGPSHFHVRNDGTVVKMVGKNHVSTPHAIIYDTLEESLGKDLISALTSQTNTTSNQNTSVQSTSSGTTTITQTSSSSSAPAPTQTPPSSPSPTPPSSPPSGGGGYGGY